MWSYKVSRFSWVLLLALVVTSCTTTNALMEPPYPTAPGEEPAGANPDVLDAAERDLAAELVRGSDRAAEVFATERPIYLVDVELVRSKEDADRRTALVTYYRYEGNLAVRSLVDLTARRLLEIEMVPDVPVPFAKEELARARQLALADEEVMALLQDDLASFTSEPPGFEIQGLGLRAASPDDPLYGHRVVSLLFETPDGYIQGVEVLIDLTTETVQARRTKGDYR